MGKYLVTATLFMLNNEILSLLALTLIAWFVIFDTAQKAGGRW